MKSYPENEWVVIELPVQFISALSPQFSTLCQEYRQKGHVRFIADASSMQFVDSYGIGVLVREHISLQNAGGELRIRNLNSEPLNLFKQTHLVNIFVLENKGRVCQPKNDLFGVKSSCLNLNLDLEEKGNITVFHLSGIMKFPDCIRKLREEALKAMAEKNKFILDMERLEFVDSDSVYEIIRFGQLLKTSGGDVCICRACDRIRDLLVKCHVDSIIPLYENLALAIDHWKK
jgi:anti-anti-sigma factor